MVGQQRDQDAVERHVPGIEHEAESAEQENLALDPPAPRQFLHDLVTGGQGSGLRHSWPSNGAIIPTLSATVAATAGVSSPRSARTTAAPAAFVRRRCGHAAAGRYAAPN